MFAIFREFTNLEKIVAIDTPKYFYNLTIYEIFVRNHGPNGTFADVEVDLPRIKSLGVDVIWFMPIYPIGKINKKGKLGCPYSIKDYRKVNPEYGTEEDFEKLIEKAHSLKLKVMVDIVFNHTAHDSLLVTEHPDWFVQDSDGKPVSTVADWSDVVDLKFPNPELENYLIETLLMWINLGVDGFRCDVASLIPVEFWSKARNSIAKIKKDFIWLAESVDARWVAERREIGFPTYSDSELYTAFDITYDYDIWPIWHSAVLGKVKSERFIEMLRFQDCIYPANYIKLRCVENHDRNRIMALSPTREQAIAWTAFQAFNKGVLLIYAGQESAVVDTPSLFDTDLINWGNYELHDFFKKLLEFRKDPARVNGRFHLLKSKSGIQACWVNIENSLYGIFNTEATNGKIKVSVEDGIYKDILGGESIKIVDNQIMLPEVAVIFRYSKSINPNPINSYLLNIDQII